MKKYLLYTILFLVTALGNKTIAQSAWIKKLHPYNNLVIPYQLYIPENYNPQIKYPIVIRFHGAGSRGSDNEMQMVSNLLPHLLSTEIRTKYPSFIVVPQCPLGSSWDCNSGKVETLAACTLMENIKNLLDSLVENYAIDPDRIYITGASMGGYGVWGMLSRYPNTFAAGVVLCGVTVYKDIKDLSHIPLWMFHSKADPAVNVKESRNMINEFKKIGTNFIYTLCNPDLNSCNPISSDSLLGIIKSGSNHLYTEYENIGHAIGDTSYEQPGFFDWLYAKKRVEYTGIESLKNQSTCKIYPNPASHEINFNFELKNPSEIVLTIQDINSRNIVYSLKRKFAVGNNTFKLNSSHINNGLYYYSIRSNSMNINGKILIIN